MSRDWTENEIQRASRAMEEMGQLNYEAACAEASRQAMLFQRWDDEVEAGLIEKTETGYFYTSYDFGFGDEIFLGKTKAKAFDEFCSIVEAAQ